MSSRLYDLDYPPDLDPTLEAPAECPDCGSPCRCGIPEDVTHLGPAAREYEAHQSRAEYLSQLRYWLNFHPHCIEAGLETLGYTEAVVEAARAAWSLHCECGGE